MTRTFWILMGGLLAVVVVVVLTASGWHPLALLLALTALLGAVWEMRQGQAATAWPMTSGRIDREWVEKRRDEDSGAISHVPRVEYTYEVGGRSYTGTMISHDYQASFSELAEAQAALGRYPPGASVSVFYDADDPERAVLDRDWPWQAIRWWLAIAGLELVAASGPVRNTMWADFLLWGGTLLLVVTAYSRGAYWGLWQSLWRRRPGWLWL
jgi:hypothetical protein